MLFVKQIPVPEVGCPEWKPHLGKFHCLLLAQREGKATRKRIRQLAIKQKRKRKKTKTKRVRYTKQQLTSALQWFVIGYKTTSFTTLSARRRARSVRQAARLFMDNKYSILQRIVLRHNVIEKIKTMTRYLLHVYCLSIVYH